MSVNIFQKSTGELKQIAGNALVGGSGSTTSQVVFSKKAEFPAQGLTNKIYIDTDTSKSYIYKDSDYVLVGEGITVDDGISFDIPEARENLVSGETIGKHFGKIAKVIEDLENGNISCPANGGSADTANNLASSSYTTLTINVSDWEDNSDGGYVCKKRISTDYAVLNNIFDVVLSEDMSAAKLQIESWNYIMNDGRIETSLYSVMIPDDSGLECNFYAFTTKPTVALTVAIQGVS